MLFESFYSSYQILLSYMDNWNGKILKDFRNVMCSSPISSYITTPPAIYVERIFVQTLGYSVLTLTHMHFFFGADHYFEIRDGNGLQDVPFRSQQS